MRERVSSAPSCRIAICFGLWLASAGCSPESGAKKPNPSQDVTQDAEQDDAALDASDVVADDGLGADTAIGECAVDADCAAKEDGDVCNGTLRCAVQSGVGSCILDPSTVVTCDPSGDSVCAKATCTPSTGQCALQPTAEGAGCDDGNTCTSDDVCKAGSCVGVGACACQTDEDCAAAEDGDLCNGTLYCDISTPQHTCAVNVATIIVCDKSSDQLCVANQCEPKTGLCALGPVPDGVGCDIDGSTCSLDTCAGGVCTPGPLATPCNCVSDADCAAYDDGNACNGSLFCRKASGFCELNPATVVQCPTGQDTLCTVNVCQPESGACKLTPRPDGTPCEDGWECTKGESCAKGVCNAGTDTCTCKETADCAAYAVKNACVALYCDKPAGVCKANPATQKACAPLGDPQCSTTVCEPKTGACTVVPKNEGGPCEADGSWCTNLDVCAAGSCKPAPNKCPCQADADCAAAEDGNPCNGTLYCDIGSGNCLVNPATVPKCKGDGAGPCKPEQCDPKDGSCKPLPLPDGVTCDSDDFVCTFETCQQGNCTFVAQACLCWEDGDCTQFEDADLCNGKLYCNKGGEAAHCAINPASIVTCPAPLPDACTVGQCNPATGACDAVPTNGGGDCNDQNACTSGDSCVGVNCVGTAVPANTCDDGNACTTDACAPATGCTHAPLSTVPCNDGNACTADELCLVGTCGGGYTIGCDDGNSCTVDSCDTAKGCVFEPIPAGGACGGLAFDGFDDRVVIGNLTPGAMPNMTFEAWVYRTADAVYAGDGSQAYETIFGDDDGGYDRGLVVKKGQVYVWAGLEIPTGMTSTLNTWEHFAVVFAPTQVRVFKNGGTPFVGTPGPSNSLKSAALGAMESSWRFAFRGVIDEVRIWNIARTDSAVQAGVNCSMSGASTGLWASYHLNQGFGGLPNPGVTQATDDSGAGHHGTLVGFALTGTTSNWSALGAQAGASTCK